MRLLLRWGQLYCGGDRQQWCPPSHPTHPLSIIIMKIIAPRNCSSSIVMSTSLSYSLSVYHHFCPTCTIIVATAGSLNWVIFTAFVSSLSCLTCPHFIRHIIIMFSLFCGHHHHHHHHHHHRHHHHRHHHDLNTEKTWTQLNFKKSGKFWSSFDTIIF